MPFSADYVDYCCMVRRRLHARGVVSSILYPEARLVSNWTPCQRSGRAPLTALTFPGRRSDYECRIIGPDACTDVGSGPVIVLNRRDVANQPCIMMD